MEDAKRSYRDILRFFKEAQAWQKAEVPKKDSPLTGFRYAIGRVVKGLDRVIDDYNDQLHDINIETASTDDKANLLVQPETLGSVFTKDNSRVRNKKLRELVETEVAIKVYFAKLYPDDLTEFQIQSFEGFVIAEQPEPQDDTKSEK